MDSVLVTDHGAVVHSVFVGLAVSVAALVFRAQVRRAGPLDERLLVVVAGTLVGGALGMRAAGLVRYISDVGSSAVADAWRYGAKSVLGGLAGAYAGALVGKRLAGYDRPTGDLFAPAVALGMAVGRWGCFLTEQIGTPTSLPCGIAVSKQVAEHIPNCPYCATGVKMHPSFIYEIIFHTLMFASLWGLRPRVSRKGELLKIYLLTYALFRFAVEFVRGNEVVWEGLTRSQLFLIPSTMLLLLVYFRRQWAHGAYTATA